MGILYNVPDLKTWGFMAFVLLALIAFNEVGRNLIICYSSIGAYHCNLAYNGCTRQ